MTKILALPGEGERLDRYELVAEIAAGGMATVYLARLEGVGGFKRFVAIKRLHPHLAREDEFIQMFLDEARLAARLTHPNVVSLLEVGVKDEQYFMVMEYVEGDTLGRLGARANAMGGKLPVKNVARLLIDALNGLHAAHELRDEDGEPLGIVHRDVSPQNILVGADGVARITDFGVARAAARLGTTRDGQLKGKIAYMAPEQVRGGALDRRADVFAAGIVLWELLTNKRLFKSDGEAETLFKVVAAEVQKPRTIDPSIPEAVEAVCMKALAAKPEDRYDSAADFADALEQEARDAGALATTRETAAYVNELVGADISQQREIVRAWLSKEPSRSGIVRPPHDLPNDTPADPIPRAEEPEPPEPATVIDPLPPELLASHRAAVTPPPSARRGRAVNADSGWDLSWKPPAVVDMRSVDRRGARLPVWTLAVPAAVVLLALIVLVVRLAACSP